MVIIGIVLGLLAAASQALCYVASRHFLARPEGGSSRQLLVLGHVWMGAASLALLPWVLRGMTVNWRSAVDPLLWAVGYNLAGQMLLMSALRHVEPSKVSPLLGMKIVFMAGFTAVLGAGLFPLQWVAVGLCLVAVVGLQYSGGVDCRKTFLMVVATCLFYAASDWNIMRLVHVIDPQGSFRGSLAATLSCYVFCGVLGVGFLPWFGTRTWKTWQAAAPFAATWLLAMIALFACFGVVGPLLGNILQSTRGLMSIGLGTLLAGWGLAHVEPRQERSVVLKRVLAAGLMFVAVVLFVLKRLP